MDNLTVIVPYFNGERYLDDLLWSIPSALSVILVDDQSDTPLEVHGYPNVRVIRPQEKGFFTGAVNVGIAACTTDALILNQDVELRGEKWIELIEQNRKEYALIGERIKGDHPAFPNGYPHGVFQYMRRDAIEAVGSMDAEFYPLWGASALWQWQICRAGFKSLPVSFISGVVHKRRGGFGSSIRTLLERNNFDRETLIRTPPAVSVVIPCYNHGRYIRDAVNSLIGGMTPLGVFPPQTFQSFEVIIVDDGSDDGETPELVEAVADDWAGVRVYHTPNGGTSAAHNFGIGKAVGKYITTMSADDMREPWALERLYRTSLANPHSLVYDQLKTFTNGGRGQIWRTAPYDFETLLYKNMVPVGTMFEKRAWQEAGGYPVALRYGREDWGFAIAMGRAGYCGVKIEEPGYLYRREGQNRTLTNTTQEWRDRFLSQMVALFPRLYRGERPMACCGGRGSVKQPSQSRVAAQALRVESMMAGAEGMVLLEYRGKNKGSQQWGGPNLPSRRVYIFGDNVKDKQKLVDKRDAEWFLTLRHNGRNVFARIPFAPTPEEIEPEPEIVASESEELIPEPETVAVDESAQVEQTPTTQPELIDPSILRIYEITDWLTGLDAVEDRVLIEQVRFLEEQGRNRKTLLAKFDEILAHNANPA